MKSLSKLFRFGVGPSSSHTIAPSIASNCFKGCIKEKDVLSIEVTFLGSLACTGVGHHSDVAVIEALKPYPSSVKLDKKDKAPHPLTMVFSAKTKEGETIDRTYFSLGGGEITSPDDPKAVEKDIYPFENFAAIKKFLLENNLSLKELCLRYEDASIDDYLLETAKRMFACVESGLKAKGEIPTNNNPRLRWQRAAGAIAERAKTIEEADARREILLTAYAYAVAESSASGELMVTAPTCGSSGVLPAILYYEYHDNGKTIDQIKDSLYVAGVFGNLVKQNASIAGAIGGCQAEIGTASSMAAAAFCYLEGLSLEKQEYAAECAMEHFLGLSCDPVDGYVVIPCIERNGMGALRAYDAFLYAEYIAPIRANQVSFDDVVSAMKLTGDSLAAAYKETARGGLAKILKGK